MDHSVLGKSGWSVKRASRNWDSTSLIAFRCASTFDFMSDPEEINPALSFRVGFAMPRIRKNAFVALLRRIGAKIAEIIMDFWLREAFATADAATVLPRWQNLASSLITFSRMARESGSGRSLEEVAFCLCVMMVYFSRKKSKKTLG